MASKADSTLMRQSEVAILLPDAPEACETGIVPTTSTTMTLALGDALAIALMEHRAFTPDHFRVFHPGGKLGARLSKVRDLMHRSPPLVPQDTAMGEALLIIGLFVPSTAVLVGAGVLVGTGHLGFWPVIIASVASSASSWSWCNSSIRRFLSASSSRPPVR